jgi:hypothetical protein
MKTLLTILLIVRNPISIWSRGGWKGARRVASGSWGVLIHGAVVELDYEKSVDERIAALEAEEERNYQEMVDKMYQEEVDRWNRERDIELGLSYTRC